MRFIPELAISGAVGYYFLERLKDPTDWNVGATLHVYNWFDVDARYYDTDVASSCPLTVGTSMWRSMRSNSGPEMRPW